jgi:hypothetical protein
MNRQQNTPASIPSCFIYFDTRARTASKIIKSEKRRPFLEHQGSRLQIIKLLYTMYASIPIHGMRALCRDDIGAILLAAALISFERPTVNGYISSALAFLNVERLTPVMHYVISLSSGKLWLG